MSMVLLLSTEASGWIIDVVFINSEIDLSFLPKCTLFVDYSYCPFQSESLLRCLGARSLLVIYWSSFIELLLNLSDWSFVWYF